MRETDSKLLQAQSLAARIEARIAPDALAIIEDAAGAQGRRLNDSVLTAAREAARHTIEETQIIRLAVEDQRAFADAIYNPPSPSHALLRAAEAHWELIKVSS
jgi:uncharacterized protein (DUF1778 family)